MLQLLLICVAKASAFSCLVPFWAMPAQFLGGQGAAGGIAAINSVGNIGGFLAPFGMGRLLLLPNGDAMALGSLATVLLIASGFSLALPQADLRQLDRTIKCSDSDPSSSRPMALRARSCQHGYIGCRGED